MTTILTEIGWEDENGNSLGTWTNRADLVDEGDEITLAEGVTTNSRRGGDTIVGINNNQGTSLSINGTINTNAGNDTITGTSDDESFEPFLGINNSGTINTGVGRDTITSTNADPFGINNSGTINTGVGGDTISGSADFLGIKNESNGIINTGAGGDLIDAGGDIGFENFGTINMGPSRDAIEAGGDFGGSGIINRGSIDLGSGRDTITGENPSGIGIENSGIIDTGSGNDIVNEFTPGLSFDSYKISGGGTIDLGSGRDLIRGFGDQIVDGGRGFDTAELGIDFDENQITFGSTAPTSIDITFDSATMSFTDVELFNFNGQVFALEQLQDIV